MRKRILATLLSAVMILTMLPIALAEGSEPTSGQLPEAECICATVCTEANLNELCAVCKTDYTQCGYTNHAPADDVEAFTACTKTEGCTLAEGHEGDCVLPNSEDGEDNNVPEPSTSVKQAEALIAALPDTENVTLDHAADVFAAQTAYDALSTEDRAAVDAALAKKLAALLSAVQALVDEQNQMTAPIPDELPTKNATCTYVSTDGTVQSESPVTLSEAVEALNEAGGGTITVVSSGLAGANNILISAEITIIAQEGNPVTVTAMPMEAEDSMFELDTLSSVTTGTSVLTLGQDDMSKGLLIFDGAKQANTTIVSNYYGVGSETSPHGVVLRDGIVLTGCTVSTIGEPESRTLPKVTMYGGQITGNYGKYAISGTPFVMEGGEIFGNVSEVATVSSVYAGKSLTIGGTAYIHDNEAGDVGGADAKGTLILQGNARITNCTATNDDGVGGIYCYASGAGQGITMKDKALIDSCQGKFVGGCYSVHGDINMTEQATIQNCTATSEAWMDPSGKYFWTTGGLIGTENISIGKDAKVLNCSGTFTGGVLSSITNLVVYDEPRAVTIEGTISGNKGAFGGGIGALDRGSITIKESAVISNNEASSAGGGIVLLNQKLTATSGTISESQKITLTVEGGTISGNRAPSGGGIYVAGAAEVLDIFSAYISAGRTPIPCKVNLQGGTITGNTATACGGGMFLGWDVDATVQGVVNIAGNTDDTGAASDLYLRQNPEMAVTDPGVSNSIKGLEDFIAATTADYIEKAIIPQLQEQIGKLSDEELKEGLVSLGVIQAEDEVERDELERLYFEYARNAYSVTYPIQAIDQLINQYRQYYDFVPSFEEFSALHKGLYKAYFEVYVRLEIANADQEDIDRAALACGLISSGESYTGPMDELMEALVELNMKNQYQSLDENAYNGFWTSPVSGAALPYDARLKVAGTLAGSNIRVNVENPQKWRVIADGKGEYTITDDDFAVFQSNDAGYYIIRSESDSNLLILMPEEVTVTLTPQDMTAYTGGDSISGDNFPSVRYAITGVESTAIPDLEFTVGGNTCKPKQAGSYWLLSDVENTFTPVVSQKTRAGGEYTDDGLAGEYTIGVENDDTLTVKGADDKQYAVKVADGEEAGILTVRNVSDPNAVLEDKMDIAQEVVSSESQVDTSKGAVAVIEDGATYYTNGKKANLGVLGASSAAPTSGEQIALLFDNILERDAVAGADTITMMVNHAASKNYTLTEGQYQFKYLDLINENDGNAWVSTNKPITIFWPYPSEELAANRANYKFTVLHFEGLHRQYQITTENDMQTLIRQSTVVPITAEATDKGVKFTLPANEELGSFSPFALSWTAKSTPPAGTHRVTFQPGDHGTLSGTTTYDVTDGGKVASMPTVTASSNYTFTGWKSSLDNQVYSASQVAGMAITGAVTFTAQYSYTGGGGSEGGGTTRYTLSYASNGGTTYKDERYDRNTVVELDKIPTREGYTFTGWYADKELTEQITEIKMTANKTVYAGWKSTGVPDWLNGKEHFAYVIGYADGTIRPLNNISRAEVATIIFRLLDPEIREANLTTANTFADVNEGMWCNTAISTLARLGIVNGRSTEFFDPDASITRAEFAAICARFDNSGVKADSNFTDIAGHWAEAEIEQAATLGWIRGYADGTFRPNNQITRAEAMTMINRVLQRLPESEDDLLHDMRVWPDNQPEDWFYLAVQEATNSHDFDRKADGVHEHWTEMTADPDWKQYE